MKIHLANPRGFCAGVSRAINIVEEVLGLLGAPVYVRHEVVHNRFVVNALREKGVVFVDTLDDIPEGGLVILSAHGTASSVREKAKRRKIKIIDATCPLVTKVHSEVIAYSRMNCEVVLIGHKGHPEVIGTMGQYDAEDGGVYLVETIDDVRALRVKRPGRLAYVTQTTLSVSDTHEMIAALKEKFPDIRGPRKEDICYATQNRQGAVREIAGQSDLVLIVGSANSSNSNRLCEIADQCGCPAYLIDGPEMIHESWLRGVRRIGVSAGASAPESLVRSVVDYLRQRFDNCEVCEEAGVRENVVFKMPAELRQMLQSTKGEGGKNTNLVPPG